jgi:hypothetical protein
MERCHRIGQLKPVVIYRLVCRGSVEERMVSRAEKKKFLNAMVAEDSDSLENIDDNNFDDNFENNSENSVVDDDIKNNNHNNNNDNNYNSSNENQEQKIKINNKNNKDNKNFKKDIKLVVETKKISKNEVASIL